MKEKSDKALVTLILKTERNMKKNIGTDMLYKT